MYIYIRKALPAGTIQLGRALALVDLNPLQPCI